MASFLKHPKVNVLGELYHLETFKNIFTNKLNLDKLPLHEDVKVYVRK